jgi:hypothetical protein
MKIGQHAITFDDLAAWLRLPAEHRVTAVVPQDAQDIANKRFRVLIEGPQLPNHADGSHPMAVPLAREWSGRTYFAKD